MTIEEIRQKIRKHPFEFPTAYKTFVYCNGTRIAGLKIVPTDNNDVATYYVVYEGGSRQQQDDAYNRVLEAISYES